MTAYADLSLSVFEGMMLKANRILFFLLLSSFEFRLRVSLATDGDLTLTSRIRNVNGKPFSFSFAYHTYLSVSDIRYGVLPLNFKTYLKIGSQILQGRNTFFKKINKMKKRVTPFYIFLVNFN